MARTDAFVAHAALTQTGTRTTSFLSVSPV